MLIRAENITSLCVFLWATLMLYITSKPFVCALGYAVIQFILGILVHQRVAGDSFTELIIDTSVMFTGALAFFLALGSATGSNGMWKLIFVTGVAAGIAGNLWLIPMLNDYLRGGALAGAVACAPAWPARPKTNLRKPARSSVLT